MDFIMEKKIRCKTSVFPSACVLFCVSHLIPPSTHPQLAQFITKNVCVWSVKVE